MEGKEEIFPDQTVFWQCQALHQHKYPSDHLITMVNFWSISLSNLIIWQGGLDMIIDHCLYQIIWSAGWYMISVNFYQVWSFDKLITWWSVSLSSLIILQFVNVWSVSLKSLQQSLKRGQNLIRPGPHLMLALMKSDHDSSTLDPCAYN